MAGTPRVHPLDLALVEAHVASSPVRFTSLDRVVYPATARRGALLKAHVLDYYLRVADAVLPHLAGRPLVFRRYPGGIGGEHFYTKDWSDQPLPEPVRAVPVWSESREEPMRYAVVEDEDGLGWLAQTGAVEAHPWLSRTGPDAESCGDARGIRSAACGLDRPDLLLLDLDPYVRAARTGAKGTEAGGEPGLAPEDWASAVEAALEARDALRSLGARSFLKTSGKRGLHVVVPLVPDRPFEDVRAVARALAEHLASRRPDLMTTSYDLRARKGRVFVDWNQNVRGKTMASAYSLRPTPEASVSTPIEWDELADVDPAALDIESVPERVRDVGDPWRGLDAARRRLEALVAGAERS